MKNLRIILLFIACSSFFIAKAEFTEGDTINIYVHDATDMTWHGSYPDWGVFPDENLEFRKITMKYTMGCASGGCSDWDYTTMIRLRHITGEYETIEDTHPYFTVNGDTYESYSYSLEPTFTTSFNEDTELTDSLWNEELTIVFFEIDNNIVVSYDTVWAYEAGYWNYYYDNEGEVTDSIFVDADYEIDNYDLEYEYQQAVTEDYELARVITPYGGYMANNTNGFSNDWEFTSYFDVTDFANLLRDSVQIIAFYDGWSSGFSVSLDFEFIVGTPPRKVERIKNLWSGGFSYQSGGTHFNENLLEPRNIEFTENEKYASLRVTPSGHGFDNNVYCAEFCPRHYYISIDNDVNFEQLMWDSECGNNPIFPQGGTWLYDRANWCPGLRAKTYLHEISELITPGVSSIINMEVEPYNWSGNQSPYYYIETQLFTYSDASFQLDAELYDIITPSTRDEFSRMNPICDNPKIVIRNSGSETLTSLDIEYGRLGGNASTYSWTGELKFMETDTVILGSVDWGSGTDDIFYAEVKNPNQQADEYEYNNRMVSQIVFPDVLDREEILVFVRTNNAAHQNEYRITDLAGNVLLERTDLENNTIYVDTVQLESGVCYHFHLTDDAKNGMSFWANNEGSGQVVLRRPDNWSLFKNFNADFGTEISYKFTTMQSLLSEENIKNYSKLLLHPNPAGNDLFINIDAEKDAEYKLEIYNINGQLVHSDTIHYIAGNEHYNIDISNLSSGNYIITVYNRDNNFAGKFIKK